MQRCIEARYYKTLGDSPLFRALLISNLAFAALIPAINALLSSWIHETLLAMLNNSDTAVIHLIVYFKCMMHGIT